jgi:nucleoside-triphosphatase THEP1
MEIHSPGFRRAVRAALDSSKPLLAAIHQCTTSGFIGEVKSRPDIKLFEVTRDNLTRLSAELAEFVLAALR